MKHRFIISLFLFFTLIFLSCQSSRLIFRPYKNGVKYSFIVPSGYHEKRIASESNYSQEYTYLDSMIFYVSTFSSTYNIEEIKRIGKYPDWFTAQNYNDTITLSGIDSNGHCWKDILLESGIIIGYTNIPIEEIKEFEEAILSLKRVRRKKNSPRCRKNEKKKQR